MQRLSRNRRPIAVAGCFSLMFMAIVALVRISTKAQSSDATATVLRPDSGSRVHALSDLTTPNVGPFPSDQFTVTDSAQITGRRINLPKPDCDTQPSDCDEIDNINVLDGFNPQPRVTVSFDGPIDINTVTNGSVFLVEFGPDYRQLRAIGINRVVWDPASLSLYADSDELLHEHSSVALIVTRGILASNGVPVHSSAAYRHFVAAGHGSYHRELVRGLRAAATIGIDPNEIVTASVFTTLSATAVLEKMREQVKADVPQPASFVIDGVQTIFPVDSIATMTVRQQTQVSPPAFADRPINLALFHEVVPGAIGTVAIGTFESPNYQTAQKVIPPVGTLTGIPIVQDINTLVFDLVLPAGPKPANGWPVAIFGHGGTASKENVFDVGAIMAAHGFATIGINIVGHGFGPSSYVAVTDRNGRQFRFVAGGRGVDMDGDNTIDGNEGFDAVGPPFASVTNRDSLRQAVVDLMQLVRVIQVGMDVDGDGIADLDASQISYFGVSQGGAYGIDFVAIEPEVQVAVFQSPGGQRTFRRLSPATRVREALLLQERIPSLLNPPGLNEIGGVPVQPPYFNENMPLRDQPPLINSVEGALAIQEYFDNRNWIEQPASPVTYARHLREEPLPGVPAKSVLLQFAKTDQSAPAPTVSTMVRAGNLADVATYYRHDLAYAENPTLPKNPHAFLGFILRSMDAMARGAQEQIATFFNSGGTQIIHPEPARFFEVPIVPPLPEDLDYIP